MTVNELKIAAKLFRIDLGNATKKSDIINLLEATGFTYEDYLQETEGQFDYKESEPKQVPIIAEDKPEPEKVEVKEETKASTEKVVLRMVHPRGALNISNKAFFTIEEPFGVFSKEKAEEILRLGKDEVRLATPEEVKSFYKV